ncbi:hypothetical protein [Embleya hyalina]|uniref:hypothetical protein n=1 Tax=Embleya hyalina TaxID=516124 RepID=UPI000F832F69|nr:hypothetical protein [Embleya hyalina]
MTTQGDIGPMPDFADDEPEFPGSGSSTRVGEPDRRSGDAARDPGTPGFEPEHTGQPAVPRARDARRPAPSAQPYEPVAGEAWGSPEPPRDRPVPSPGDVEEFGSDPTAEPGARDPGTVGHAVSRVPPPERIGDPAGDFALFRTGGRLTAEVAEVSEGSHGEPVSMLAEWFGEPDSIPSAPRVEHETVATERRAARRHRSAHRGRRTAETARTQVARGLPEERSTGAGWEFVTFFVVPALILAGLLYHFGWTRAVARSDYLGFDESVLGTPAREYPADALRTLYRPLLVVTAGLLAARMAHPRLLVWLRRHRRIAGWCVRALRWAWLVVPAAVLLGAHRWPVRDPRWEPLLLPGALAVGLSICAYGVLLSRRIGAHRRGSVAGGRPWSLPMALTAAVVVLCLFWASGSYAKVSGRDDGRAVAHQLPRRTGVVLYSVQDLRMRSGDGIAVEEEIGASYRYRYTGLRLLRRAPGTLFLLPEHWSWRHPRLLVVHEDARVRVEYERTR